MKLYKEAEFKTEGLQEDEIKVQEDEIKVPASKCKYYYCQLGYGLSTSRNYNLLCLLHYKI